MQTITISEKKSSFILKKFGKDMDRVWKKKGMGKLS